MVFIVYEEWGRKLHVSNMTSQHQEDALSYKDLWYARPFARFRHTQYACVACLIILGSAGLRAFFMVIKKGDKF